MQMRRVYNIPSYLHIVEELKKRFPLFNFTTDIMVGFPGETDQDFAETCDRIKDVGFSHVHTFKYSIRRGTRAERMPDQVPETLKQQRSRIVRNLAAENKLNYRKQFIGSHQTVLVEKLYRNGIARGYGEHYIPIEFKSSRPDTNYFQTISLKKITPSEAILNGIILS
jgi:threonylcarbamoyladenosine tRNA methylthiotransferase MtaB